MKTPIIAAFGAALMISGCAAMFHGTSQQVSIRSNVPESQIYVNDVYLGKDNQTTVFEKKKSYTITVKKMGCEDTTIPTMKSFDAITLLGVLIDFGVVSVLVVDGGVTGAWQQFDQTSYVVDPHCTAPSAVTGKS